MQTIFIHGPAACGKLTVARELVRRNGYRLFHNHLAVDSALALFDFGTPGFVALREQIWLNAFGAAAENGTSFVFTFHPEASVDPATIDRLVVAIETRGGRVRFVELRCAEPEIERRIESAQRAEFKKLSSLTLYRKLRDEGAFVFPPLPKPVVVVDTDQVTPSVAAERIEAALRAVS